MRRTSATGLSRSWARAKGTAVPVRIVAMKKLLILAILIALGGGRCQAAPLRGRPSRAALRPGSGREHAPARGTPARDPAQAPGHQTRPRPCRWPALVVTTGVGTRHPVAQAHRLGELADLPPALAGHLGQGPVGVDGDRMADGLEHGQVGGRVRVGASTRRGRCPSRRGQLDAWPRPCPGRRRRRPSGRCSGPRRRPRPTERDGAVDPEHARPGAGRSPRGRPRRGRRGRRPAGGPPSARGPRRR